MASPERLYICHTEDCQDIDHQKHLTRYKFAAMFVESGYDVLDCACGSGYGSRLLCQKADAVIAVDQSEDAIAYAKTHNAAHNIDYLCRPIQDLDFTAESLDAVVCLETLEHVPNKVAAEYLHTSSKWIKPGGCFIGSSPMLRYKDGQPYVTNDYHVNEMPRADLIQLISRAFGHQYNVSMFHQGIKSVHLLNGENTGFLIFVARKQP